MEFAIGSAGCKSALEDRLKPGKFYVYVHKSANGEVFYVGKGTGSRAYSKDRQPEWYFYVDKVLNGNYQVEIVVDCISEEDAYRVEDALLAEHAATTINLQNMHAPVDFKKMNEYNATMRDQTDTLRAGQKLEKEGKLSDASALYEKAYFLYGKAMSLYDFDLGARRLLPKPRCAPTQVADRYSKCLAALGQYDMVAAFTDRYFKEYGEGDTRIEIALKKRAQKALKIAGQ